MPKNTLYINHPEIVKFPGTEISVDATAGATSITALNNADIASNNLLLIGSYNREETEIVTCSGITGNTVVSVSATKFAHPAGVVLTKIDFNQYVLERNTTETGTFTAITTANLQVDESQNKYVDNTTVSSAWYKYRFYDTAVGTYSDYSDSFQIEYKENSLKVLRDMIKLIAGRDETDENLKILINWYQRKISSAYNFGFMETTTTKSSTANMVTTSIPSDCKLIKHVKVEKGSAFYHPDFLGFKEFKIAQLNTVGATIPNYWTIIGNEIWFHNPFASLGTNNITLYYYKFPARLDSDNDVTPVALADALVNRIAYQVVLGSNPQKAEMIFKDYQGSLAELKAIYGVDQMAEFDQVGYGKVEIEEILEINTT